MREWAKKPPITGWGIMGLVVSTGRAVERLLS